MSVDGVSGEGVWRGGRGQGPGGTAHSHCLYALCPQVRLAEAVLWEESGRVAGIFAQCQCQQSSGGLCGAGGDSADAGAADRCEASPV